MHASSVRHVLEKDKDRQVKSLERVGRIGTSKRPGKELNAKEQDAHHLRLPGRKKAEETEQMAEDLKLQKALLKSLYQSNDTVALLHQIPNMKPFLQKSFSMGGEANLIKDLEAELRERTPIIRGMSAKMVAHDRSVCNDILYIGSPPVHTLLAEGRHLYN